MFTPQVLLDKNASIKTVVNKVGSSPLAANARSQGLAATQ